MAPGSPFQLLFALPHLSLPAEFLRPRRSNDCEGVAVSSSLTKEVAS
jgi:hypothetical protein